MSVPVPRNFVLQDAPRAELARLCRQICLAREQGKMSPVAAVDEIALALTTVRATYGTASISDNDLKDIVDIEETRVADAAVLAELISSRLAAALPAVFAGDSAPATPTARAQTTASLPTPIPFPSVGSPPQLDVADLIDGMLAQEKRDIRTSKKH